MPAPRHSDSRRLAFDALEERLHADLLCGRHALVVAELDQLTQAHPFRERLWSLRMLALYRAGRQVEAVRTYQQLRSVFAEHLGLEPSPALARLERAILRHDADLDLPSVNLGADVFGARGEQAGAHETPSTRYATSNGVKVAYQIVGDGPVHVVFVPGFVSNVDAYAENPGWRKIFERLAGVCRLIVWDKRGTGLSDPVRRAPTLDERAEDLLAVMDAITQERTTGFSPPSCASTSVPTSRRGRASHASRARARGTFKRSWSTRSPGMRDER